MISLDEYLKKLPLKEQKSIQEVLDKLIMEEKESRKEDVLRN